jgi:ECF sigma factor
MRDPSVTQKRSGGAQPVSFDESLAMQGRPGADLVALDDALNALAAMDGRRSRVVELRFFGGLSSLLIVPLYLRCPCYWFWAI